nr:alkaline phosphatase D family protein [uncultured Brevundimonas sp.]
MLDSRDERSPVVATEFVGTSITSGGPPYDALMATMPANPHIKFFDSRERGYISMDVTPQRMTARYQAISDVRDPKASLSTLKTWSSRTAVPAPRSPEFPRVSEFPCRFSFSVVGRRRPPWRSPWSAALPRLHPPPASGPAFAIIRTAIWTRRPRPTPPPSCRRRLRQAR